MKLQKEKKKIKMLNEFFYFITGKVKAVLKYDPENKKPKA